MEINYDRTLGEEFGLPPVEYADIAINELQFSIRVSKRLQRDNIHTVADLLNTTTEHLMGLAEFDPRSDLHVLSRPCSSLLLRSFCILQGSIQRTTRLTIRNEWTRFLEE